MFTSVIFVTLVTIFILVKIVTLVNMDIVVTMATLVTKFTSNCYNETFSKDFETVC